MSPEERDRLILRAIGSYVLQRVCGEWQISLGLECDKYGVPIVPSALTYPIETEIARKTKD